MKKVFWKSDFLKKKADNLNIQNNPVFAKSTCIDALFNVIICIMPIIISINLSKFLKIQTKSSLLGPIQQNGLKA